MPNQNLYTRKCVEITGRERHDYNFFFFFGFFFVINEACHWENEKRLTLKIQTKKKPKIKTTNYDGNIKAS